MTVKSSISPYTITSVTEPPEVAETGVIRIDDDLLWPAPFVSAIMDARVALRHASALDSDDLLVVSSGTCLGFVRVDDLHRAPKGAIVLECGVRPVVELPPILTLVEAAAILARTDGAPMVRRFRDRFGTMTRGALHCAVAEFALEQRTAESGRPISGFFPRSDKAMELEDAVTEGYYAEIGGSG